MPIKREHKVVIVAAVAVMGVLAVGGAVFAVRWFQEARSKGAAAAGDGAAYAKHHDAVECVDESLRRLKHAGLDNEVAMRTFLKACLADARRHPKFCNGVPPKGEMMKSAIFALEFCERHGRVRDQRCGRSVAQVLPEACSAPAPSAHAP